MLILAFSGHDSATARAAAALLITVPHAFRLRFPLAVLEVVLAGVGVEAAIGGRGFSGPVFPVISVLLSLV